MDMPLVSVVMPVYNSEKYLKEAIESVLSQSYKNIELVLIDDGSTDSSKNIILSYADSRIRLIENDCNSGIVFSRNKGLASAAGVYVATLDSDDIAFPDRIEKQVGFLENNPDYGMCGTFYCTIDSNGTLLKKIQFPTDNRDIITFLTMGNCFCNSTMMIRSDLAKELRYKKNYDIVEDYELWYRISKKSKITNLPINGTYYRVHENSISVARIDKMFAGVKEINRQILTDLNIGFSEMELEIHSNWLNGNVRFFEDNDHFEGLDEWVNKFYEKVRSEQRYNNRLLFKLIAEKWIVVAFNVKRYKKLFYNRLFRLNRRAYMNSFYRRVYIKIRL